MNKIRIDRFTFFMSITTIVLICLPIVIFPNQATQLINLINKYLTSNFGFLNIWMGIFALISALWFAFSKYGNVVLGQKNEKPEFNKFSWAAMLFCAGIGSGVMYWGSIEWAYYLSEPPFGMVPGSWEAAEMAATYGIFHWGPIGWALYALPALPIAYSYFVRQDNVFKISEALRCLLGSKVDGFIGKIIDILFIFGAVGATATSLGLGIPLISAGVSNLLGIEMNLTLNLFVLFLVITLFSMSAYSGLKKGIQVLSNINIALIFIILLFVLITGPTLFILKMGTTSLGLLLQNFFRMSTWMDPVNNSGFTESWTVFYWAWWIISSPLIGLFIARISRGMKVKTVILGSMIFGTMGCAIIFVVFGNLGLHLQLTGELDVIGLLNSKGGPIAIISVLETLTFNKLIILGFSVAATVFTATTFDSVSYILASVTTKQLYQGQEPAKWNRLFWAFALGFIPMALLVIDGPLYAIQTVSIITALPIVLIMCLLIASFKKMVDEDLYTQGNIRQNVSGMD